MILTLTPNPSVDLLFVADRLVWDDANRVPMPRRRPGGQGVNVVRAARALDPESPALAVLPLGGAAGDEMATLLGAEGTPFRAVPIAGETRVFVGVRETATDRSLLLNPRGPTLSETETDALMDAVVRELDRPQDDDADRWLACCGSLPPGLPADFYARAGRAARVRGWRFVPDCDGDSLARAVDAGCDLLVPNIHEAERLLGCDLPDLADAADGAADLLDSGPGAVAITRGVDGAVLATAEGVWTATAGPRAEGSAVGAGDAFLAALLLAFRARFAPPDALVRAVAAGTGTLLSQGADLVTPAHVARVVDSVRVERLR